MLFRKICIPIFFFIFKPSNGENQVAGGACELPPDFMTAAPNSKFAYLADPEPMHFYEAFDTCKYAGLEPAVIKNSLDLIHLQNSFDEHIGEDSRWALGIMFDPEEGSYMQLAPNSGPMPFQVFEDDPSAENGILPCVVLQSQFGLMTMEETSCLDLAYPLCQFNSNNDCYKLSPQELAPSPPEMVLIGSIVNKTIFASRVQRTFNDALYSCAKQKMKLLDLNVDINDGNTLYSLIDKFQMTDIGRDTAFWTSGQLDPNGEFSWVSTGEGFGSSRSSLAWAWDAEEPMDNLGFGVENCVTVNLPPFSAKRGGFDIFLLRMSSCKMPYYYMCYKDETINPKLNNKVSNFEMNSVAQKNGKTQGGRGRSMKSPSSTPIPEDPPCYYEGVPKLNLTDPAFDKNTILKLQELVAKYDLQSGKYIPKPIPPQWRNDLVNVITKITKKLCPSYQVPHEFINIMWNLIHMYLAQVKQENMDFKIDEDYWINKNKELQNCSNNIIGFYMEGEGDLAVSVEGDEIPIRTEIVDITSSLDMILDTFWFMWQISMGACYPFQQGKTDWLVEYFMKFGSDVLFPYLTRWTYATDLDYGVFIGDIDINRALYNLRICTTGIFVFNSIVDRQLARPLTIDDLDNEFID